MLSLPSHFWNLCVLALAVSGSQATSKPLCIPKIVSNLLCQLFGPDIIVSNTAKLLICVGCGCMLRWNTNELDLCLLTIENINRCDTNPEKIMTFCNELLEPKVAQEKQWKLCSHELGHPRFHFISKVACRSPGMHGASMLWAKATIFNLCQNPRFRPEWM